MAAMQRGLGKGLDALFQSSNEKLAEGDIKQVPIENIAPNQFQPRRSFSESSLQELALSIRSQGVLQPILVRIITEDADVPLDQQRFELIAGERRLRAAKLCDLKTIPAVVKDLSDDQSLILAMIENLQREDLNPLDEAAGLARLQKRLDASQDDLARAVGKSRSAIANALRLLHLPESVQEDLRQGVLTAGHARALLGVEDPELQRMMHNRIREEQLSVRQVEQMAAYVREHGQLPDSQTDMPSQKPKPPREKSSSSSEPAFADLEKQLQEHLSIKVRLQGSAKKGKMVLSYTSEDELHGLLALLGMEN